MAVKCGWASCSEHDSAYGADGLITAEEFKTLTGEDV